MTADEYFLKFDLVARCRSCGKPLPYLKVEGVETACAKCRDRFGAKNSFYGKTHSTETLAELAVKCRGASIEKWKDPTYRQNVVSGTSKPRRAGFGAEQSRRIRQWYQDNPEQRNIRSRKMALSWKEGKIKHRILPQSPSKAELRLLKSVRELSPHPVMSNPELHLRSGKRAYPDLLIEDRKWIVEFLGDFWHANPSIYKPEALFSRHGIKASEIWEKDAKRKLELSRLGYIVIEVWQSEFEEDREGVLRRFDCLLNWE